MKLLRFAFCALWLGFFSGCSSPLESRISRQPQVFARLDASTQAKVRQGHVEEGFSQDAVLIAGGRPSEVEIVSQGGAKMERWHYSRTKTVAHPERTVTRMSAGGRRGIAQATMFDRVNVPGPVLVMKSGRVATIQPAESP